MRYIVLNSVTAKTIFIVNNVDRYGIYFVAHSKALLYYFIEKQSVTYNLYITDRALKFVESNCFAKTEKSNKSEFHAT